MASGLLTIGEAAEATYLSKSTVRRKIAAGEIEAVRLGERSVRVWAASVAGLLERGYEPRQHQPGAA